MSNVASSVCSTVCSKAGSLVAAAGSGGTTVASLRNPTANDDTAHGATANMIWVNTASGAVFKATSVGNGAAVWVNQNLSAALPLDGVATGAAAAYGLKRLRAAYAGNCCVLTRASDSATLTLGFTGDNVDTSGVAAFTSGTTAYVTTWFDQSGNARDATKALATAPQFVVDSFSAPHIIGVQGTRYLDIPAGLAVTDPNVSMLAVVDLQRLCDGNAIINLGPSASNELGLYSFRNATFKQPTALFSDPFGNLGGTAYSENNEGVIGMRQNAVNGCDYYYNEATGNTAATGSTQAVTGGQIGHENAFNGGMSGFFDAVLIYTSRLSDAARVDLWQRLFRQYSIAPQRAMNNLVGEGDSIAAGTGGTGSVGWFARAHKQMAMPPRSVNVAIPGVTAATLDTDFVAYVAPLKQSAARKNIIVLAAGTNDLSAAATAAAVWTTLQSLITKSVAAGFQVAIATILPLGAPFETARTTLNASIRSGYAAAGATYLLDFANDSVMGQAGQNTNTTYYDVDAIHPNDVGHARLATIALPVFTAAFT